MTPRRLSPVVVVAWLALVVVGSILSQGYHVGAINHGVQLPIIRHFAGDPTFEHDVLVTEMARTYTTAFYPALGWAMRVVPLQALLLSLFVLFRVLCSWLAFELGRALWKDDVTGLVTAALLAVQRLTFADDVVSDTYLTHGALAQAMMLASLWLLVRGRIVGSLVVAGVLFNIHALHATHLVGVVGLAVLFSSTPKRIARLAMAAALVVVLVLPTVLWMRAVGTLGAPEPSDYVGVIKAWFPTHFWMSTWSLFDWTNLLFPLLFVWPLWSLAKPGDDVKMADSNPDGVRMLARVVVWSLLFGLGAGVVTELAPTGFLLRLHPLRVSCLVALAGAPFLAHAIVRLAQHPHTGLRATGLVVALGIGTSVFTSSVFHLTMWPAVMLAALVLRGVPDDVTAAIDPKVRAWPWLLGMLLVSIALPWLVVHSGSLVMTAGDPMRVAMDRVLFLGALYAGGGVVVIVLAWLRPSLDRRALLVGAAGALTVSLAMHGLVVWGRMQHGSGPDWVEVQEWCKAHRPAGDVVMVPLTHIGLRAFSNQTPAVDFQEGDLLFHLPTYTHTFTDKLALYGWTPAPIHGFSFLTNLEALDEKLTVDDVTRIGHTLHASIAVRQKSMSALALPVLFENGTYRIYAIP